jgi:hypothetical protein
MRCDLLVLIFTTSILTVSGFDPDLEMEQIPDDEARARIYLDYLDKEFSKRSTQSALAEWSYASNITEENLQNKVRYGCSLILFSREHLKFPEQLSPPPPSCNKTSLKCAVRLKIFLKKSSTKTLFNSNNCLH